VGTEILVETPWFTSPTDSELGYITERVQALSEQDAAHFKDLANSLSAASRSQNNSGDIVTKYLEVFKFYSLRCGTVPGNRHERDVSLSGLFHKGSLFQRSCQPNVHAQWIRSRDTVEGRMVFRTIRDILPGEFLSVSTDIRGMLYGRDIRHQRLFDSSGQKCPCPIPQPDQATSDGRRANIKLILDQVSAENAPPPTHDLIPDVSTQK
jgi:hypothetical protein